jgi:membrane-associated protease RseP (regulator of RpoE activity)
MNNPMESEPRVLDQYPPVGRWAPPSPPPSLPTRPSRPRLPPWVNFACFLMTVLTTLVAGTLLTLDDFTNQTLRDVLLTPALWTIGFPYSVSLILILGAHEMGHYVMCRKYGIDATLPFFIPGFPPFGTFGAVIRIRSPFTDRRALFDIGVAGPLAGFVVALPILAYGVSRSVIVQHLPRHVTVEFSSCILLDFALRHFIHDLRPGQVIELHPVVAAAWVGLLATFLNLLPIGQLDGGHMLYALSRRAHRPVSLAVIVLLIVAGSLFAGYHLIVFGVLWAVLGPRHPPVVDDSAPIGWGRVLVALVALAIFILCFIPQSPRFG